MYDDPRRELTQASALGPLPTDAPIIRIDAKWGGGTILAPKVDAVAPPMRPSPEEHPPVHVRLVDTYAHPYEHTPHFGGKASFPSPLPFYDPAYQNIDGLRVDWRRPNAIQPLAVFP